MPCQLITQVNKPATGEWQVSLIRNNCPFLLPPVIKGRQKITARRVNTIRYGYSSICIQYQAVTRKSKQDVISTLSRTLQNMGIAFRVSLVQLYQVESVIDLLNMALSGMWLHAQVKIS